MIWPSAVSECALLAEICTLHNSGDEIKPTGPLAGIKIVDLSTVVFGPYATQLLGDLGADVVKVENGVGDVMRRAGPSTAPQMGAIYLSVNRNKRSVLLDLKTDGGIRALRRIIEGADVFFTNVRMDGLVRLGLGYEEVVRLRPDILYVHCAGYGSGGEYAGLPAYDDLIQAASGVAELSAISAGGAPRYMPALMADKVSGLHAAYATIAGLFARSQSGTGQFIEAPMFECFTAFNLVENMFGQTFVPPLTQPAYTRSSSPNRKPFRTQNGYIGLLPYSDDQWTAFFAMGDRPDVMLDARFKTYQARTANIDALYGLVAEVVSTKTTEDWLTRLRAADIPSMRCNSLVEAINDPHLRGSGFVSERQHPTVGNYLSLKHPVTFSQTPANIRRDAPYLGQHTEEVLQEVGVSEADINSIIHGPAGSPK